MAFRSATTLTIVDTEPPPRDPRGSKGPIDWKAIEASLKKASGKWGTLGPWRSSGRASAIAKEIADDKTALDAALYELEPRPHTFDDGVRGSILWIRHVGV